MRLSLSILAAMLMVQSATAQSLWRNFFTTNRDPIVEVVAGSNATVQASTVGVNLRRFTVNSIPGGTASAQTNISWTAVTNLQSAQVPYTVITNAPWQIGDSDLTNWATLNTNVLSTLGQTNISYTAVTNAPWQQGSSVLTNLSNFNGGQLTNVPFTIWSNYTASPNIYSNLNGLAFGSGMYGMTNYWLYTTAAGIGPIGIYYLGIDTNTVITTNGGAFSGTIVDNSANTNAPVNNQLVTAQWVRGLFAGSGVSYYATTNINNTFTNAGVLSSNVTVYEFSTNIPVHAQRTYIGPTNGSYFGSVVVTNKIFQLNSGITVNAYLSSENGTGTGGPQVKPEIYISYDKTNWLGDWDAAPQFVPEGSTNLYSWVISNPSYTSTNATGFYVERRFKMVTQPTPAASDIVFHLGTNMPSHITLSGSTLSSGNAYLSADQTFTGSNYFSTPLTLSLATNTPAASQVLTATSASSAKWTSSIDDLYIGTLVVTNAPVLNLESSTNLLISSVAFPTNTWSINGPVYFGTNQFASVGAVTGGITGISGFPAAGGYTELNIKATGDITFTNATAIAASDYVDSRTITNGNTACIAIEVITGVVTNMAIVQFK